VYEKPATPAGDDAGSSLRVLVVHNRYQQSGGEDSVVRAECSLLEQNGHKVTLFSQDNRSIQGGWDALRVAARMNYSKPSARELAALISAERPDVVHVHNYFPLASPAVFDVCYRLGLPVVHTLHNYRLLCPGALLMRRGTICTKCATSTPYRAVLWGCYRGSPLATLAVARMIAHHRKTGTWTAKVTRFIALTEFARAQFVSAGLPSERIVVKPNFFAGTAVPTQALPVTGHRAGAVFVGRLSPEKGLDTMLQAWGQLRVGLTVIGGGPDLERLSCEARTNPTILVRGPLAPPDVYQEMARAAFLVVPSHWYEGFPMVIVEAFAHGLPAIVSRLGSLAEVVEDGKTGLHFNPADPSDLACKVSWAAAHPQEMARMGANARQAYEELYTADRNLKMLVDVYLAAIEDV
jgi:glycosyltransferase involved in cell wall biosynthesis